MTRLVLAVGIVGGLLIPIYFFFLARATPLAWDFRAYLAAAEAAVNSQPFVGIQPSVGEGRYVYPPIVVVLFAPYALPPEWWISFVLQTATNVALGLAAAALIVRTIERHRDRLPLVDRALVAAFCVLSTYAVVVLGQGQVDHLVLLLLAVGYLAVEEGREVLGGVLFGAMAVIKLFPALFGVWLLYRRRWRAVVASAGAVAAALAAGVVVFGVEAHVRYARLILAERSRVGDLGGSVDPNFSMMTLAEPLSALLPGLESWVYVTLAAALLAPVLGVLYLYAETARERLVAFLGTLIVVLLASPASMVHHAIYLYFPLLVLLYVLETERTWPTFAAGTALMAFPVQPAQVHWVVDHLALSDTQQSTILGVVMPVLRAGSVTLYALLLILVGCVVAVVGSGSRGDATDT